MKRLFAIFLTLAMIASCSVFFSFAEDQPADGHFYVKDQNNTVYNDGDTIEIPLGYAAFIVVDNTYQTIDGKKVHPFFFGNNLDKLNEQNLYVIYGDGKDLGFSKFAAKDEYGMRIDTAYYEGNPGDEIIFEYYLTEDKDPHEWEKPGLKLQTLKIKITERPEEAQADVSKPKTNLTIKTAKKTVKLSAVRKKAVTFKPLTAKVESDPFYPCDAQLSYKKVSGKSCLSVNKKTGKVTVKKGTKKGTYTAKIKIMIDSSVSKIFDETPVTKKVTVIVK